MRLFLPNIVIINFFVISTMPETRVERGLRSIEKSELWRASEIKQISPDGRNDSLAFDLLFAGSFSLCLSHEENVPTTIAGIPRFFWI